LPGVDVDGPQDPFRAQRVTYTFADLRCSIPPVNGEDGGFARSAVGDQAAIASRP
jgi:hypothetical protein